jgi:hypothetical protein
MAGVLDWLDNLTTQVGNVAGRAVDVVGQTQNDQTAARPVASAQVAFTGGSMWLYVAAGAAVLIGAVILLRK